MTIQTTDVTAFYDGACPLCSGAMVPYRGRAGAERVDFVDVSMAAAGAVAPGLDKATGLKRFYVRGADRTLASGAAGLVACGLRFRDGGGSAA